jgi:hypothetical protein
MGVPFCNDAGADPAGEMVPQANAVLGRSGGQATEMTVVPARAVGSALRVLLLAAGLLAARWLGEAAEVRGKAVLRGPRPLEMVVSLTGFPEVTKAYPNLVGKLTTRHYVVGRDAGLANVFVYVKDGLQGRSFPVLTNTPVLDQTNAGFYPYVMGVMTNQTFLIRNSEPYMDTVIATPRANAEFNIAQPLTGMVARHKFEQPEVLIRIKCGIHPWEFAFIGVVEHPFFAVTDADGRFSLPTGLPAGRYELEAVHPKAGRQTQTVTLAEGETKTVEFVFEAKPTRTSSGISPPPPTEP